MLNLSRWTAGLAIVIASMCTTAMNWRFSYQLGTNEWDSYTWAIFSVALDVTKWVMLPCAALAWTHHKLRALAAIAIWLVATIYSFSAAIGFAALNRDITTSARSQQVELQKTIETMKQSPRWHSSAACADATSAQSKQFCATYRATEMLLKTQSKEPDPQSALFAKLTGFEMHRVQMALSLFLAIACEIISALGFFAILTRNGQEQHIQPQAPAQPWRPPAWQDMTGRDTTGHVATRPATPRRAKK